jgi:threonine/homoserine efflux transporter RhtA
MARTVFQLVVALAAALPALVGYLHLPTTAGLAAALGIAMVITRVMAMPEVNEALRRWVPWLAAEPPGNAG